MSDPRWPWPAPLAELIAEADEAETTLAAVTDALRNGLGR